MVVAEKPSVARDIARVLGADRRADGYLWGNGWAVTWAVGHLVELPQPHEINPEWRRWRRDHLPLLPREWPLVVSDRTREQFEVVRQLLLAPEIERVVCATDAGREGELIFRYIVEAAGCDKPVSRLWISSLTADAIKKGFARLRDGREMEPLADAARGRSRADWLVGMNLSRAYSLDYDEELSVGRVQTPTLAMVVERELAIRAFVPEDYLEVVATFAPSAPIGQAAATYRGTWFQGPAPTLESKRLYAPKEPERAGEDFVEAMKIVSRVKTGKAAVESVRGETRRMPPPLLYDLTELQRHANRLWSWSAQKTLGVAQALYEQKKLLSYPRTDSRHLSVDVAATLLEIVAAVRGPYQALLAPGTGEVPLGRRFVDDAKVTDHHAILPTSVRAQGLDLSEDERRLYDLVCRRLLGAWHGDHVTAVTTVITAVSSVGETGEAAPPIVDRFHSSGTAIEQVGWKVLDLPRRQKGKGKGKRTELTGVAPEEGADAERRAMVGEAGAAEFPGKEEGGGGEQGEASEAGGEEESQDLPAGLAAGLGVTVVEARAVSKQTRPPQRFTDATLLTAMETAGRALDDRELSEAMRESGLGTPATRAEIIETLLRRLYVERQGKALAATDKGLRLIEVVHPQVKSPEMTGRWEAELGRIQRGQGDLATFLRGIESYVREVVGAPPGAAGRAGWPAAPSDPRPPGPPPAPSDPRPSGPPPAPAGHSATAPGPLFRRAEERPAPHRPPAAEPGDKGRFAPAARVPPAGSSGPREVPLKGQSSWRAAQPETRGGFQRALPLGGPARPAGATPAPGPGREGTDRSPGGARPETSPGSAGGAEMRPDAGAARRPTQAALPTAPSPSLPRSAAEGAAIRPALPSAPRPGEGSSTPIGTGLSLNVGAELASARVEASSTPTQARATPGRRDGEGAPPLPSPPEWWEQEPPPDWWEQEPPPDLDLEGSSPEPFLPGLRLPRPSPPGSAAPGSPGPGASLPRSVPPGSVSPGSAPVGSVPAGSAAPNSAPPDFSRPVSISPAAVPPGSSLSGSFSRRFTGAPRGSASPGDFPALTEVSAPRTPVPPERLEELLRSAFRLPSFRPYQEAVCRAVTAGQDVLLVMPTGAGKSLCYQLPGLARGGTTLVICPSSP